MEGTEYLETLAAIQKELVEERISKATSSEINELAEAMSKAQGMIEGAKKDSENPFFKSSYADLASCWDACREALSKNGLAVIQTTTNVNPPFVCIETTLMHSSGQWIRGFLTMKSTKEDPQGMGSAITYARRYALSAIVGIAPEDDDGNDGSGKGGQSKGEVKPKKEDSVKSTSGHEDETVKQALKRQLAELCCGDTEVMRRVLKDCSVFKGNDGKEKFIDGSEGIEKAKDAWVGKTLAKVRERLKDRNKDQAGE